MKKREKLIFLELLKNSKISDRELGRKIKASQSAVTRFRNKLEKKKFIIHYNLIPDLHKIGIGLIAFRVPSKVVNHLKELF